MEKEALPVVTIKEFTPVTSSQEIARSFKVEHKSVLTAFDHMKLKYGEYFKKTFYIEIYEPKQRIFVIDRHGFDFLLLKLRVKDGLVALVRYCQAFDLAKEKAHQKLYAKQLSEMDTKLYKMQ